MFPIEFKIQFHVIHFYVILLYIIRIQIGIFYLIEIQIVSKFQLILKVILNVSFY